jgi:hypothetical protein
MPGERKMAFILYFFLIGPTQNYGLRTQKTLTRSRIAAKCDALVLLMPLAPEHSVKRGRTVATDRLSHSIGRLEGKAGKRLAAYRLQLAATRLVLERYATAAQQDGRAGCHRLKQQCETCGDRFKRPWYLTAAWFARQWWPVEMLPMFTLNHRSKANAFTCRTYHGGALLRLH